MREPKNLCLCHGVCIFTQRLLVKKKKKRSCLLYIFNGWHCHRHFMATRQDSGSGRKRMTVCRPDIRYPLIRRHIEIRNYSVYPRTRKEIVKTMLSVSRPYSVPNLITLTQLIQLSQPIQLTCVSAHKGHVSGRVVESICKYFGHAATVESGLKPTRTSESIFCI